MKPSPSPSPTATVVAGPFCNLPGSVQSTETGLVVVPGGPPNTTDLNFLHLPVGFCAHYYARLGNPRQLRFAPGGDLFVASPTTFSTGGGPGGQSSIVILPDDNHDGIADTNITYLRSLPSTQGLLFANGYLYYQDRTKIRRTPFASGDRAPTATSEIVADITVNVSALHWPKPLDIADDGTIYVGNGADQNDPCSEGRPFKGGILKLDGSPNGAQVAKGFRNPISLRCRRGSNRCYAIELAKDFTGNDGGREKLVPIRDGDDWGFPCCATKDLPYKDVLPRPDCSTVTEDNVKFFVGNTPFDLDFEMGKWPEPWKNRIFMPLHGVYGTWSGARVVSLEFDPITGDLLPGSDINGMSTGAMRDFATGWGDGTMANGRPGNVAFAPDGRLFLSSDVSGLILWIAPMELAPSL